MKMLHSVTDHQIWEPYSIYIPQQPNIADCGIFVLCSMKCFIFGLPLFVDFDSNNFRQNITSDLLRGTIEHSHISSGWLEWLDDYANNCQFSNSDLVHPPFISDILKGYTIPMYDMIA